MMKSNTTVKFLLYVAIPVLAIYLLFRLSPFAGVIGIVAWILLGVYFSRVLFYRIRGQSEYQKGNLKGAAEWFGKAAGAKNASMQIKISYGFILLKSGQLAEAEKVLTDCVKKSTSSDDKNYAKSNLALVLWKKGNLDEAISMLEEVIKEYKTTAIYGSLGYLLIEKGDLDEALKFNLEAWDYNPDNAIILDNLAHLYHLRGEMDKAGEIFAKLHAKEPRFPEAFYDYGKYLEDMDKPQEAAGMYRKALSCTFSFNSTITKEHVQQCLDNLTDSDQE